MKHSNWLPPRSLDEPIYDDPEGTLLHENVPADETIRLQDPGPEQLWAELMLDLPVLCSPRDLERTMYRAAGFDYPEIAALEGVPAAELDDATNAIKQSIYRVRKIIRRYVVV
ncbi:hypothetical protein LCGC14_2071710 [marine sediment metagenome]|uniref:Uncharacterized protein n=1 Tax=marine sediment metagenome TaxID=412755 RepID=A0A0F9F5M6_9ZZZZ